MINEIERLQAEIITLKREAADKVTAQQQGCSIKISEKGAVSLYGLGRFPVTLYADQWKRLFCMIETVKVFIDANQLKLASKPTK